MLCALSVTNEKIQKLEREVHDLKLLNGKLMNAKNAMMLECDANLPACLYVRSELKELKSNLHHWASSVS